jgi:hypothetical protein
VVLENDVETRAVLYNTIGQAVKQLQFQGSMELFLGDLSKGIYVIHLSNEEGVATKKIVLE